MSDTLKPCPFCGKPPIMLEERDVTDDYVRGTTIRCDWCRVEIADEYRNEATRLWNRRPRQARAALSPSCGNESMGEK